jgi:aarF domain-containing kinase
VLNDIPFSIPPYFAILGRAIVTLEGVALTGNPDYGIIMESYPFIARKLMQSDRPEIQAALQEVLYSGNGSTTGSNTGLKLSRLLALLNNAAGAIATKEGAAFVDLDAVPKDGISFTDGLKFVLSDKAESLRNLLESEVDTIVDIVSRQIFRKGFSEAIVRLTPPSPPSLPFLGNFLPPSPKLDELPLPLLLPGTTAKDSNRPSIAILTLKDFTNAVAPRLSQEDEIFALGLSDAATEFFGEEIGNFVKGQGIFTAKTAEIVLVALRSGVMGRSDVLSPQVVQTVIDTASNMVSRVRGSGSGMTKVEKELTAAMDNLDNLERAQLDEIVQEITRRTIARTVQRLSAIDRIV